MATESNNKVIINGEIYGDSITLVCFRRTIGSLLSKGFPYAVELTLFIEKRDDEFFSQKEKSTVVRVVKIPIYESSQGGSTGGTK